MGVFFNMILASWPLAQGLPGRACIDLWAPHGQPKPRPGSTPALWVPPNSSKTIRNMSVWNCPKSGTKHLSQWTKLKLRREN